MILFISFSSCQGVKAGPRSTLLQSLQLLCLFLGFFFLDIFFCLFTTSVTLFPSENSVYSSFYSQPVQFCSIWTGWRCVTCCCKAVAALAGRVLPCSPSLHSAILGDLVAQWQWKTYHSAYYKSMYQNVCSKLFWICYLR